MRLGFCVLDDGDDIVVFPFFDRFQETWFYTGIKGGIAAVAGP